MLKTLMNLKQHRFDHFSIPVVIRVQFQWRFEENPWMHASYLTLRDLASECEARRSQPALVANHRFAGWRAETRFVLYRFVLQWSRTHLRQVRLGQVQLHFASVMVAKRFR